MKKPIAVLGAGSWGTALAIVLAQNNQNTRLWGHNSLEMEEMKAKRVNEAYLPAIPFPIELEIFSDLSATLEDVGDLLIVVPSHAFRSLLIQIKPYLNNSARIAWATKGLDPKSGQLLSHVVEEILGPDRIIAVLSGPSFAKEVAEGLPTAISLACHDIDFAQDLSERFHRPRFRVYENGDLVGTQLCGTVKNVMAIAAGISDGFGFGANARCALITRGLAEMARLCAAMEGESATVMGLAGVGDLVLTCTDNQSRNRRFGLAIAQGKSFKEAIDSMGQVVEGYSNAAQVYALAQAHQVEMPIIEQIYKVLYQSFPISSAIQELLNREPRQENF